MAEVATGKSTPIVLEEVIIRSPLNPIPFNIANVVTELEVFEHIDKHIQQRFYLLLMAIE